MPFKPKLFEALKSYSKKQLINDALAGLMVAIIAMPVSVAIAVASGVGPERGIYTSVIAGFLVAALGGSNVNITGPTAAFITIVYNIVANEGVDGLILATIMAGIILIFAGFMKLGSLIKYIPLTIITGFSAGLSISIIIGQIRPLLGLALDDASPIEGIDKLFGIFADLNTFNLPSFLIGLLSLAIMIGVPKLTKKVPPTIIAITVGILTTLIFKIDVSDVGDFFENVAPPTPAIPTMTLDKVVSLIPAAFTIAMLAAIESMLSSVISDGMINDRSNSNTELIALGVGNIASGIFGGIPATGAIARTTVNIKNGGRTPISAMIHSGVILLSTLLLLPLTHYIPMPTIAAILIVIAFNMADWKRFVHICKTAANAEIIILIVTFVLTVVFNLMTAIATGLILTAFLFLKEMADSANVRPWTGAGSKIIPEGSAIYELNGPMFFAATDKLLDIDSNESGISVIILRASNMTLLDIEAIRNLEKMVEQCKKNGVTVIVSHVKDQPLRAMQKVGLISKIGEEYFVDNVDEAIEIAERIIEEKKKRELEAIEAKKRREIEIFEETKRKASATLEEMRHKAEELREKKKSPISMEPDSDFDSAIDSSFDCIDSSDTGENSVASEDRTSDPSDIDADTPEKSDSLENEVTKI
jgi:SulP family sulfate permease